MKTYINRLKFLASIFFVLAFCLYLNVSPAQAQFPGTNGRILWASPSSWYTIKPDGTDVNNTTIPSATPSNATRWGAAYNHAGTIINYIFNCSATPANFGLYEIDNLHSSAGSELFCPTGTGVRFAEDPAVSQDGTKIAFSRRRVDNNSRAINVVNADGSSNVNLTSALGSNIRNPVWSANGSFIYAKSGGATGDIIKINSSIPDTLVSTVLSGDSCRLNDINPANTQLLYTFAANCGPGQQLFTVSEAGGVVTQITNDPTYSYVGGYFSPDGTQIVAIRIADLGNGEPEMIIMDADGSNITEVPNVVTGSGPGILNSSSLASRSYRPMWSTDQTTFANLPICTLTASPATLESAGTIDLDWESENTTTLTIDQGIGEVPDPENGSVEVNVAATTTFTATAVGDDGETTCTATVTVGVTPTPDPDPDPTPDLPNSGAAGVLDKNSPILYVLIVLSGAAFVVLGKRIYKKQFTKKISQSHE